MFNWDHFDQYYKHELTQEMKRPKRETDQAHFKSRKSWDRPVGTPFKDSDQKEEDLHSEYKLYQEKKLEQQERIRLFYILEQLNEKAR